MGWAAFSVLSAGAVLPVAAASWFLVERPAIRAVRHSRPQEAAAAPPVACTASPVP
jgi:peptidoglycan/LPS O-acetylase OafA/YrhL